MISKLLSPSCFEFPLRSRWRKGAFLLSTVLLTLLVSFEAVRISIASNATGSANLPQLRRAVAIDPRNPGIHNRLGLVYLYGLEQADEAKGLRHLRRATQLNPYNAIYWSDLASACDSTDDTECADQAFARALKLSPMTPILLWMAANHYILTNRTQIALTHFRRLLALSRNYAWPAFELCMKVQVDPGVFLEKVLSAERDPRLKLEYADFLSSRNHAEAAERAWNQAVGSASYFPFALAKSYLENLLRAARYQQALEAWHDLQRLEIFPKPPTEDRNNLIFNGGFEQAPLNAGFDWRYHPAPYVSIDFTDTQAYKGAYCLRVDFTASTNVDFEPVDQIIPVTPDQEYLLTAYTRSQDITSESGPRLRVLDPIRPESLNVSSEMTTGTTPWHPVALRFVTGAQTDFVRLSVWRPRSRTFPTEITGTFWVDSVSLKTASSTTRANG